MKTRAKIIVQHPKTPFSSRVHVNIRKPQPTTSRVILKILPLDASAIEDHLWVQKETEKRAALFWLQNDGGQSHVLNDWLMAEDEVLAEYAKIRKESPTLRLVSVDSQTSTASSSATPVTPRKCLPAN